MSITHVSPSPAVFERLGRWRFPVLLAVVAVCGLGLRLTHLGQASLWNDELFTRFYTEAGLRYIWTDGFWMEPTPPLYNTVMFFWAHVFGTSEAMLRLPSVIASTLTIPLVGLLGREFGGRTCGLIAATVFALSPTEIYYAQEARAYAFMLPPLAIALLGLAQFLRDPGRPGSLFVYTAAAGLAMYVHSTAVFIVAACGLAGAAAILMMADRARWPIFLRWALCNVVLAILFIPELLAMVGQTRDERLAWIAPTTFWDVRSSIADFLSGPATTPLMIQTALASVFLLALVVAIIEIVPNRRVVSVLIAVPVLDFLLILAASMRQPILLPRLLCWMWIPLSVLLAYALVARRRATVPLGAAAALLLAAGLVFQLGQDASAKEPWRPFLLRIAPLLAGADLVVTGPWTQPTALVYYGANATRALHWDENQPATIENTKIRQLLDVPNISRDDLRAAIRAGKTVVLIQRSVDSKYLALLDVPAPTGIVTEQCWTMGACLTAMYWNRDAKP